MVFIIDASVLHRSPGKTLFLAFSKVAVIVFLLGSIIQLQWLIIHLSRRLHRAVFRLEWRPAALLLGEAANHVELAPAGAATSASEAVTSAIILNRIFEFFLLGGRLSIIHLSEALATSIDRRLYSVNRTLFMGSQHAGTVVIDFLDVLHGGSHRLLERFASVLIRLLHIEGDGGPAEASHGGSRGCVEVYNGAFPTNRA